MNPPSPAGHRLIALLGNPVEHSLSPRFQNAAIRVLGLDAEYRAIRCEGPEVPGLIREITTAGGAGNVTLPHKEVAARSVDEPSDAVIRTGACNTFWLEAGRIHGDNTDVVGVSAAVESLLGRTAKGMRVLLLGAGGAARGAACALSDDGAREVVVVNRSIDRARDIADRFGSDGTTFLVLDSISSLRGEEFDLVVNATSLGIHAADPLPLDPDAKLRIAAGLDLVYRPGETEWVHRLRSAGIPAADGLEMLLQQGAAAFTRWWGRPAPVEAMRAALPSR